MVVVPHCPSYVGDRKLCVPQEGLGFGHAVNYQEFFWRFSCALLEDFREVASVEVTEFGYVIDADILHIFLLDEVYRFFYVEIAHFGCSHYIFTPVRACQIMQEHVDMTDYIEDSFLRIM